MTIEHKIKILISVVILWGVWLLAKYEIDKWLHANPLAYYIFGSAILTIILQLNGEEVMQAVKEWLKKK